MHARPHTAPMSIRLPESLQLLGLHLHVPRIDLDKNPKQCLQNPTHTVYLTQRPFFMPFPLLPNCLGLTILPHIVCCGSCLLSKMSTKDRARLTRHVFKEDWQTLRCPTRSETSCGSTFCFLGGLSCNPPLAKMIL